MPVAWPAENLFLPQSGPHTVYSLHTACGRFGSKTDRERRVVQIKRHQWLQHHNRWNQSLQFQASVFFSPHVIDLERTQHHWRGSHMHACTHTNKQPHPPVPRPDPDLCWTSSPSYSSSRPSQWVSIHWIGQATGARMGVDEGPISSERLLCFSNDGLNERHHLKQHASVNKGTDTNSLVSTHTSYSSKVQGHYFLVFTVCHLIYFLHTSSFLVFNNFIISWQFWRV